MSDENIIYYTGSWICYKTFVYCNGSGMSDENVVYYTGSWTSDENLIYYTGSWICDTNAESTAILHNMISETKHEI